MTWNKNIRIFTMAYLQLLLVNSSVVFNAKDSIIGLCFTSIFIAIFWLENIKMAGVTKIRHKLLYIFGSFSGTLCGNFISNYLISLDFTLFA